MKQHTSLKVTFFYKHLFICNPKLCINQAIKVTKNDVFDFLNVFTHICSSQL